MPEIIAFIESVPYISETQKAFYTKYIKARYEKILVQSYENVLSQQRPDDGEPIQSM